MTSVLARGGLMAQLVAGPTRRAGVADREGPPVTVLMTARNEERRIARALRSVQAQTYANFRMLVVDDGSTDGTADVVRRFAARDPRFEVVDNGRHESLGVAAAANLGLRLCETDLVARLDADDLMLPRRLERQVAELRSNPSAVAVGTYGLRINERFVPLGRLCNGPAGRKGFQRTSAATRYVNVTHSSVMYRRKVVAMVGGYPVEYRVTEDLALFNRLIAHGEIYAIPELLMLVTIRSTSLSSAHLYEEELGIRRIRREQQLGWRFDSFAAYLEYERAEHPDWAALERAIAKRVAQRQFGRILASGHIAEALAEARRSGMAPDVVRATMRRVLSGR